jgi:hypothetical protein
MLRMMRMESTTPVRVPDPPKMETPPSSTMVMMSSSKPTAVLPRTAPNRAAIRMPARAETTPEMIKRLILTRRTLTPE